MEVRQRLETDETFLKLKNDTEELIGGIEYAARNETLRKLQSFEESLPPFKQENKIIPFYKKPWVLGLAATISIIVFSTYLIFFQQQPGTNQDLFNQHFQVYPNIISPTVRGTEAVESIRQRAYFNYDLGHYNEALNLLQQLPANDDEGAAYLYSGICYLMLEDNENAIQSFNDYKTSGFDLFLPQVNWYLGLTYLRTDQVDMTKKVWKEIQEGNSYRAKSEAVLSTF